MKFYTEKPKDLPIYDEVDILVLGSGPAGFGAAIAAARQGMKTLIVEQLGVIGGIATSGLMSHWVGRVDNKIYFELLERSANLNEDWEGTSKKGKVTKYIDNEKLKHLMLKMLQENNVKILLYTFVSDAIVEENIVKGAIIENKSGRMAIMAKRIIDCTGDGDFAKKAGAEYIKGRETDGKMQPATLMFKVGGVDSKEAAFLDSFESTYQTERGELQSMAKEHIPYPAGHLLLYKTTLPGIVNCNMTNCIAIDGTNTDDLTKAEIICRDQIDYIIKYLREYVPGYEKCFVISTASLIGIRETRHFIGEYTITEDDIKTARQFDEWVVKDAYFNFDVHNVDGCGLDKTGVQKQFKQEKGYTIPYGCLLPKKIENLLLAGRNISGTHIAHSNFRAMPICMGTGCAASIAAAISIKNNCNLRNVNVKDIQSIID
jgi:hypothetical protein